jgi:small subunit ribosomal protein S16
VLEELGTYDPQVRETDARALLKTERLAYWLGVGALPSDKVKVLIKKYGPNGTHVDAQAKARERLAMPTAIPDPGEPKYVRPAEGEEPTASSSEPAAEAPAAEAEAPAAAEAES